jgi:hypothetical protein
MDRHITYSLEWLDKPGDVGDSNRRLHEIHWNDWENLETGDTVTEDWIDFGGLNKLGDVQAATKEWTEFSGLNKAGDRRQSNRGLDVTRTSDVFHLNSHHNTFNINKDWCYFLTKICKHVTSLSLHIWSLQKLSHLMGTTRMVDQQKVIFCDSANLCKTALAVFLSSRVVTLVLGTTQLPIQWVPGALSPVVKQPGCEADHSITSTAKIVNGWSCTSTYSSHIWGM